MNLTSTSTNAKTMEQSHSLTLNEQAYHQCPDPNKNIFLYEWLRYLYRILPLTKKVDLKDCQQKLLEQLTVRISTGCSQPSRILLGRCISKLFTIADASHLFETINTCNDALKDASAQTQVKLTALSILGEMYENLGRMVGRTYEETFQALAKWMKSAESGARVEILKTLSKMINGLGSGMFSIYKEAYKILAKALTDRVMTVRAAAANCFGNLVALPDSPLFIQHDLDSICTLCIKALHSSSFEVRQAIARTLAKLSVHVKTLQGRQNEGSSNQKQAQSNSSSNKSVTIDELFQNLANGMLKGGVGGFLKTAKTATGIQAGGQFETRIGIAEAYVAIAMELGQRWLKQNIQYWCRHLLELASKYANLTSSNERSDPLIFRRCLHFIFRSTIGSQLSEPDQISACKYLGAALAEYNNSFDCAMDSNREEERIIGSDANTSAQASVICLMEIGCIALQVDTAITSIFIEASGILEPIFSCLLHPIQSVRIAAAWCLKCVIIAIPSMATPLIDRCLNRLEYLKKSPEAISGFSLALSSILAQSKNSPLGIPFSKSRQVFTVAEDLIKSATQTPRLMLRKVQAGWLLISSVISLGNAFTKPLLPRLFTLWRISFPRSAEETKTERGCGDANTWEATLEARAGALGSMGTLVEFCPELIVDELAKKLIVPIETSLSTMAMVGDLLLIHGVRIRSAIQLLHLRLFSLLLRLPIGRFESSVNSLLKELVAEITLSDNAQSAQRNSLCASCCSTIENTFLDGWINNMEQGYLEKELNSLQTSLPGTLENDPLQLVEYYGGYREGILNGWWWPEPQPLQIAALDSAIQLYARVFPVVSTRCKLQLLQHFSEQLKSIKPGLRLQAIQLNILTAICLSAKTIGDKRNGRLDDEQLQQACTNLVLPLLANEHMILKTLAIETLGRLAQAVSTPQFVASNAQYCFDKIRTLKDESSRQGFALALGTLHRYMGSLGSGQHLNTSIGILLALSQDINCSSIKPWAIFSISLIASTGGGMFCPYAEPARNLCLQLLLNTTQLQLDVVRSIAKLIFSLISAVGPELSTTLGTIEPTRQAFLVACSMLIQFDDPLIKSDAIACYQHLHLFAPRFVELNKLVLTNCELINTPNFLLRKSAISCLLQLLQQESKEVREHIKPLVPSGLIEMRELDKMEGKKRLCLPETGLEGALFEMLDTEVDREMRQYIKQSLLFLLQANLDEMLGFWLLLCKDILASSQLGQENLRSTLCINLDEAKESDLETSTNDDDILQHGSAEGRSRQKLSPRWTTRVFAFDIVQRLLTLCETERAHLDLALAKELQMSSEDGRADYLILHLSDLFRMGFMGATSENFNLRIAGLNCLQNIIMRFAKVAEPEFPGHVLLEQFQAQVGAALRPAFTPETPGNVTALACQVASTWICSGVARDLNDLRRVHQLLASSLAKLTQKSSNALIYNESISTLEKLAILRAWAKVYICAIEQRRVLDAEEQQEGGKGDILELVEPELDTLIEFWFAALRDFAIITLPTQFHEKSEEIDGTFFTPDSIEICREHYCNSWPMILLACTVWIRQREEQSILSTNKPVNRNKANHTRLYLMTGICIDSLCTNRHCSADERPTQLCLSALKNLLLCELVQLEFMADMRVPIELLNVLYKIALTRDGMQTQRLCIDLVGTILIAAKRKIIFEAEKIELDQQNGNEQLSSDDEDDANEDVKDIKRPFVGGEGKDGIFKPNNSLVFAILEVLMCILVRQIPQINLAQAKIRVLTPLHVRKCSRLSVESDDLITASLELFADIPALCCTEGQIVVLPSLLNLIFGVVRECSQNTGSVKVQPKSVNSAIKVLRRICSNCPHPERESKVFSSWESIMRSALLSLLNLVQECQKGNDSEQCSAVLFTALVLFLSTVTASPSTSSRPDSPSSQKSPRLCIGEELFGQFCRVLRKSLNFGSMQSQLKAVHCIRLLFQCKPICGPFVRELGNDVFEKIRPFVASEVEEEEESNGTIRVASNEDEVKLIEETVQTIEAVLANAEGERERLFVSLLVRSLTQFLQSDLQNVPFLLELHEFALSRLNIIGIQHPESFKALLQVAPEIRIKIDSAAKERMSRQKEQEVAKTNQAGKEKQMGKTLDQQQIQQPSIKLATNFKAFNANAAAQKHSESE